MDSNFLHAMNKARKDHNSNPQNIRIAADENLVSDFLNTTADKQSIQKVYAYGNPVKSITEKYDNDEFFQKDTQDIVKEIRQQFDIEQADALINYCKTTVIDSVVGTFGLSHILFQDKTGGNVTTIHNAQKGIYANPEDQYHRSDYQCDASCKQYKNKMLENKGKIIDEYTGKNITNGNPETDHVYSLKKYHENGGYMQNNDMRSKFAQDENNYAVTDRPINRSKREQDLKNFEGHTIQESKDDNKKRHDIDDRRTNAKYKKGLQTAKKHLPNNIEKAEYYIKNSLRTGLQESGKFGLQQAIGLIITEISMGVFDEIKDIYSNGIYVNSKSLFDSLKTRVAIIIDKVKAKWKSYLVAFKDGSIAGFLSNFATLLINLFITTEAKFVRMIREGFSSICKAAKLIINPPENMSLAEASHEASKLIATGLSVSLGILIDEALCGLLLTGPLAPFAGIISSVVSSLATGIMTCVSVYAIDKIDFFNVNENQKHKSVMDTLEKREESVKEETAEYWNIITNY